MKDNIEREAWACYLAPDLSFTDVMKTYKAVCAHSTAVQKSDESMSARV